MMLTTFHGWVHSIKPPSLGYSSQEEHCMRGVTNSPPRYPLCSVETVNHTTISKKPQHTIYGRFPTTAIQETTTDPINPNLKARYGMLWNVKKRIINNSKNVKKPLLLYSGNVKITYQIKNHLK